MPVFTFKDPTSSEPKDLLNYQQEFIRYLKWLLENLDEDNCPTLKSFQKGEAEPKTIIEDATLLASSWLGSSAPYIYSFTNKKVTENNIVEVVPSVNITAEQLEALQAANITGGSQSQGVIVMKAWGEVPSVDIPITVIYR